MSELAPHTDEVRDLPPPSGEPVLSASRGIRQTGDFLAERQAKPNVDIKNGKVIFRQKPMSFEKMTETMQDMVNFREWLESRAQRQEPALVQIPQNYWPVIAKFTQGSDKTIVALSKHIQQELVPDDDDDDDSECPASILPLCAIESVVKLLATRVNYGIESPLAKTPAALCVWRWELKQEYLPFLPKVSRDKVDARLADRIQYKKDLQAMFDALPVNERNALLGVKGSSASPSKSQPVLRASSNEASSVVEIVDNTPDGKQSEMAVNAAGDENQMTARKTGRAKTTIDPEKAVEKATKEKERLEKKAAKAEKERKVKESQEKARSIMANFFGKPKASSSTVTSPSKGSVSSSSNMLPDFDRVFKPFVLKRDAELAPVNWFRDARKRKRKDAEVIVIDEDGTDDIEIRDVEMHEPDFDPAASPRTHLRRVLSACPSLPTRSCSSSTVRSMLARLSEAEVSDDTAVVRALLSELHDRTRILAKVLIFHEDERPGYYGTFTKRSRFIRPRRPFARDDIAIDYSYDSGEEWGEEEEGGGDEIMGDSDDERDDEEGSDDLDGWLVDGDDGESATPVDEREGLEAFPFPPLPEGSKHKRKAEQEKEKEKEKETDTESKTKKRKAVVPLVPFVKGPCWEAEVGDCEYEPFNNYRIQLFNDTPYPIDPFSFVSVPADVRNSSASASGSKLQPQYVLPALPPHLLSSSTPVLDPASSNSIGTQQPQAKRSRTTPKNPFPDSHLPLLKEKVASMSTTSLISLVEALYLDLKTHGVKKNAIEAKIREICIKGQRHIWSVKTETELPSLEAVPPH